MRRFWIGPLALMAAVVAPALAIEDFGIAGRLFSRCLLPESGLRDA
jgi:hypothetical protein